MTNETFVDSDSTTLAVPTRAAGQQRGQIAFFKRTILRSPSRLGTTYRAGDHPPGSVIHFGAAAYVVAPDGRLLTRGRGPTRRERRVLRRLRAITARQLARETRRERRTN